MIEPQIVNEVWPQVRFEWCVFLCKILMFLNALLILHCKYWYFASSGQSHWHLLEGVAELCVGDFLIESVYNLRKYIKNLVFLTLWFYQPPSQNRIPFFYAFRRRGAHIFFWPGDCSKNEGCPVERFRSPGTSSGLSVLRALRTEGSPY